MSAQLKSALSGNKPPVRFADLPRTEQLKSVLLQSKRQITSLLEDETKANKFLAASLVVANDPTLRNCSPDSIVQALIGVAMSNLSVDKNIAQCYLVPYKDSCQLQIGYRGWVQLLFRSGWMTKCFPVYKCDVFTMEFDGWNNSVKFTPAIDIRDDADNDWVYENLRGFYVIARNSETNDEYSIFVSKATIEKLRKVSPNQRGADKPQGIWKDWYIEMGSAKALKKLAKSLPIGDSRAVAVALTTDDKNEIGHKVDYSTTIESGLVTEIKNEAEPDTSDIIDESTGEIIDPEEPKPDPYALGKALKQIAEANTLEQLDAVAVGRGQLDNEQSKTVKDAYTKRAAALKKAGKAVIRDWVAEIAAIDDREVLLKLMEEMSDGDQKRHKELLDDRLDFLRD